MSHQYIVHEPPPSDLHGDSRRSIFTTPIAIDMGDEGSEYLEAKIREKTGETVKADEDWTRLSGRRSIDTSVAAGFMFQSGAGDGCSIQVTENGNLPIQILIDRGQDFGMFLVATLRHEQWTTSGKFYLRFVRRLPMLDKPCTAPLEGPSAGSAPSLSDLGTSSTEEPESSTTDEASVKDVEEEQKSDDQATGTTTALPVRTPFSGTLKDAYLVPLAGRIGNSDNDEELTDEEDQGRSGAAALKGTGGGIIPPGMFPPPE